MASKYKTEFCEIRQLGSGGFSTVFEAMSFKEKKNYAIKKIPINSEMTDKIMNEVNILSKLKSDCVVNYIDSWIENNYYLPYKSEFKIDRNSILFIPENNLLMHIQMELCSMNLDVFIKSINNPNKNSMNTNYYVMACELFTQLLECVKYLHEQQPPIIHRDLKPENIMIMNRESCLKVKIADFGLSTYHERVDQSHTNNIGTERYRAPELNSREYDTKADIYSLGIIMERLFNINHNSESINTNKDIQNYYENIKEISLKCVSHRPKQRPECKTLLNDKHLWDIQSDNSIINILILGETGVGMSTWINGFVNYLTYPSLAEAKQNELLSLIASSFTITDNNYEREITCGENENEVSIICQSATKHLRSYVYEFENVLIRIIDTPGIGDTRGIEQDKRNFDMILGYLTNFDKLHGICILLKPNNAGLSVMFRFCIKELLTHLHRDASRNIVFCFTNARSTFYRPGDTMSSLVTLLRENKDVEIKLSHDTIYCMDNETFRFLCAIHDGIEFDEKEFENYSKSWNKSVNETKRMLEYICGLTPHAISNTLSLKYSRKIIVSLSKPMADITQNILTIINVVEDNKEELQISKAIEKNLEEKLYMEAIQLESIQLTYPRTVCTDKKCVKIHKIEGSEQYRTEFDTHCHTKCFCLSGTDVETYPNPALKSCVAMDGKGNCQRCGCSWEMHMYMTFEQKQVKVKVIDKAVESLLKNKQTIREAIELKIKNMEQFVTELYEEKDMIIKTSAKFCGFLKANSIVPYNDALGGYLEVLIRMENDKVSAGGDRKTLDGLEKTLIAYKVEVMLLETSMGKRMCQELTAEDINILVINLCSLKHTGKELKQLMQSSNLHNMKFEETRYKTK